MSCGAPLAVSLVGPGAWSGAPVSLQGTAEALCPAGPVEAGQEASFCGDVLHRRDNQGPWACDSTCSAGPQKALGPKLLTTHRCLRKWALCPVTLGVTSAHSGTREHGRFMGLLSTREGAVWVTQGLEGLEAQPPQQRTSVGERAWGSAWPRAGLSAAV